MSGTDPKNEIIIEANKDSLKTDVYMQGYCWKCPYCQCHNCHSPGYDILITNNTSFPSGRRVCDSCGSEYILE